jgi:hypothetical protein
MESESGKVQSIETLFPLFSTNQIILLTQFNKRTKIEPVSSSLTTSDGSPQGRCKAKVLEISAVQ